VWEKIKDFVYGLAVGVVAFLVYVFIDSGRDRKLRSNIARLSEHNTELQRNLGQLKDQASELNKSVGQLTANNSVIIDDLRELESRHAEQSAKYLTELSRATADIEFARANAERINEDYQQLLVVSEQYREIIERFRRYIEQNK
jgi:peptidoglycan hydrolase CwlO-like protein